MKKRKKLKWVPNYALKEDNEQQLKIKMIRETRAYRVFQHNWRRRVYKISGIPMPKEWEIEWLYDNHTRKKIKRRKK